MSDDEDLGEEVAHEETTVVIATSDLQVGSLRGPPLIAAISKMVNDSYGYNRLSGAEVRGRLAMGDDPHPNRVLHVASRGGTIVGCCSSTLQPPWTPSRCGHWGLLVAAREAQGTGVASALVAAAESRLRDAGCTAIQIEYEFDGDTHSQRLYNWYEGKLEFVCGAGPPRAGGGVFGPQFRKCRKKISRSAPASSAGETSEAAAGASAAAPAAAPSDRKRKATCQIV